MQNQKKYHQFGTNNLKPFRLVFFAGPETASSASDKQSTKPSEKISIEEVKNKAEKIATDLAGPKTFIDDKQKQKFINETTEWIKEKLKKRDIDKSNFLDSKEYENFKTDFLEKTGVIFDKYKMPKKPLEKQFVSAKEKPKESIENPNPVEEIKNEKQAIEAILVRWEKTSGLKKPAKTMQQAYEKLIMGKTDKVGKPETQEFLKNINQFHAVLIESEEKFGQGGEIEKEIVRAIRKVPFLVNFTPVGMVLGLVNATLGVENATAKEQAIEGAKFVASIIPVVGNLVDVTEGIYGLITGKRIGSDLPQTTGEALFNIGIGIGGFAIDVLTLGTMGAPIKAAFKIGLKVGLKELPKLILKGAKEYIAKKGIGMLKKPIGAVADAGKWLGETFVTGPAKFVYGTGAAIAIGAKEIIKSPIQTSKKVITGVTEGVGLAWDKTKTWWKERGEEKNKPVEENKPSNINLSLYISKFDKDLPANKAGMVDVTGEIYYSSKYFEKKYNVALKQEGGKNIFVYEGKEYSPKEFFQTETGAKVLIEMKSVKAHESTHRVLESIKDKIGIQLESHFKENYIFENIDEYKNKEANFENIQEFLCEVADGRIYLTPNVLEPIKNIIVKVKPDFNFENARQIDTKSINKGKGYGEREKEAYMSLLDVEESFKLKGIDPVTAKKLIDPVRNRGTDLPTLVEGKKIVERARVEYSPKTSSFDKLIERYDEAIKKFENPEEKKIDRILKSKELETGKASMTEILLNPLFFHKRLAIISKKTSKEILTDLAQLQADLAKTNLTITGSNRQIANNNIKIFIREIEEMRKKIINKI